MWTPPATWAAAFRPTVFNLDARRGSGQELEVQLHNIRLMYKIQCFEGFLSSGHRDAKAVSLNFSPAQLRHRFGRIDLKRCRAWLSSSAPARALMTGSFWSPAACGTRVDGLDQMCPMCCTALGTFPALFLGMPQKQTCVLFARLFTSAAAVGWVSDPAEEKVLGHMCSTVDTLWDLRHGK